MLRLCLLPYLTKKKLMENRVLLFRLWRRQTTRAESTRKLGPALRLVQRPLRQAAVGHLHRQIRRLRFRRDDRARYKPDLRLIDKDKG